MLPLSSLLPDYGQGSMVVWLGHREETCLTMYNTETSMAYVPQYAIRCSIVIYPHFTRKYTKAQKS